MKTEIRVKMNEYGDRPEVQINNRERFEPEAELALAFIEKWGMVAAEDGGEDSSGRHKLRLSTPAEVIERAFSMAAATMEEARKRGLTLMLPSHAEIDKAVADHKEAKKSTKATA